MARLSLLGPTPTPAPLPTPSPTPAPTSTPTTDAVVPVVVLAGQSNADFPAIDYEIVKDLRAQGGAFEFVRLAVASTSLFANAGEDWDPASGGELTDRLIAGINAAIANVRVQGGDPDVTVLWVQGENDRNSQPDAYLAQLDALFAAIRGGTGQPDTEFVIAVLSDDSGARTAQFAAAATIPDVSTIETRGLSKFDLVHYTDESAAAIARDFLELTEPKTPAIPGYLTLLEPRIFSLDEGIIHIDGPDFEPLNYTALFSNAHDVTGGQAPDRIVTGAGADRILAGGSADYVDAGAGDDFVDGEVGNDTILGGDGNDTLLGRAGSDHIEGGAGNDVVFLGRQDDTGSGGPGDDLMIGDLGKDVMSGGSGADVFQFSLAEHSTPENPDRILDFQPGEDSIELRGMGALVFIGAEQFTAAGQVRAIQVGGDTLVEVNLSGNLAADMVIELAGLHTLSLADFAFA